MINLKCPVCGQPLVRGDTSWKCAGSHSFDIAAKGYVNLLVKNTGGNHGDSKEMLAARRRFLQKGYYLPLSNAINSAVLSCSADRDSISVTDCCCGEGYYTNRLFEALTQSGKNAEMAAFDISKDGVRFAAGKTNPIVYFAASVFDIPLPDGCSDICVHSFAPFCSEEIARITAPGGYLIGVIPGAKHLWGLKTQLYQSPYLNDETGYECDEFELVKALRVYDEIKLDNQSDIHDLFFMTPYFWRTPRDAVTELEKQTSLTTPAEFVIKILKKRG